MSEAVYMLNALWFRENGGAEKYGEYAAAATPILAELGARVRDSFVPELAVIGEWDPDLFFVVEWPDWPTFLQLREHPGYQKIAHLRTEALRDSLLIRCRRGAITPSRGRGLPESSALAG